MTEKDCKKIIDLVIEYGSAKGTHGLGADNGSIRKEPDCLILEIYNELNKHVCNAENE